MLMALQFQSSKQDETLGSSAHETGGALFRSRLNKDPFASLDYRKMSTCSDSNQVFIPVSRFFDHYPRKLSGVRKKGEMESKITTGIDGWGSEGFVKRFQRYSYEWWCRFRIYVPCMFPPIAIFLFRELYLEGYDLIKTIVSKLKYYKTRQDAEFHKNTFKEDQKCH